MNERAPTGHIVVTAALIASEGRLFVAQRPPWKRFGLLWEFPGGKVEPGEDLKDSLIREIREELCLDVKICEHFRTISHVEEDFAIHLHAYWCTISGGEFCLKEHVAYEWAEVSQLRIIDLTKADRLLVPFLESLSQLPDYPGDATGTSCPV
jgi:8-oxo-dGTP diphosphatase